MELLSEKEIEYLNSLINKKPKEEPEESPTDDNPIEEPLEDDKEPKKPATPSIEPMLELIKNLNEENAKLKKEQKVMIDKLNEFFKLSPVKEEEAEKLPPDANDGKTLEQIAEEFINSPDSRTSKYLKDLGVE